MIQNYVKATSLLTFIASLSLFSACSPSFLGLPGDTPTSLTILKSYVCDTSHPEFKNCPANLSDKALITKAKMMVEAADNGDSNPECDLNSNNPTCGSDFGNSSTRGYVDFLVFSASNGTVTKRRVHFEPDFTQLDGRKYTLVSKRPSTLEVQGALKLREGEQILTNRRNTMSFQEFGDGLFRNPLGDSPSEVAAANGFLWSGQLGCFTATDWLGTNIYPGLDRTCSEGLTKFIDGVARNAESSMSKYPDWIKALEVDFGGLKIALNTETGAFSYPVRFNDNSILVVTITPSGDRNVPPEAEINFNASRDSRNKDLASWLEDAENAVEKKNIPAAEAANYLLIASRNGRANFSFEANFYDYTVEYTVAWPDGPDGAPRVSIARSKY